MIVLICGVGRAGKTTYSQRYEDVIHFDSMGTYSQRFGRINEVVSGRDNVVIEGIYNRAEQRKKLLEAYKGNGRYCVWLNTPHETVTERMIKDRIPISPRHFDFVPPTVAEGWDEVIVIRGDDDVQRYHRQEQN